MLNVKDVSFYYEKDREILKNISFGLDEHEILCLLGPNGTGKTTLLRCLLSLNKIKHGTIEVDGLDFTRANCRKRAQFMAYVPQANTMVFPYKVYEIVMMGRISHFRRGGSPSKADKEIVGEVMQRLEITHLAHKVFQQMSGGEKQMVLVARALAQKSRILIMDEPTANLDYGNQVKILKIIKSLAEEGYSILMTSHFPDHAFLACTNVVLMRDGVIMAQGSPESIVTTENLTMLYQTPVCVAEAAVSKEALMTKVCVPLMR